MLAHSFGLIIAQTGLSIFDGNLGGGIHSLVRILFEFIRNLVVTAITKLCKNETRREFVSRFVLEQVAYKYIDGLKFKFYCAEFSGFLFFRHWKGFIGSLLFLNFNDISLIS